MDTVILNGLNLTAENYHITSVDNDLLTEAKINTYIIPRGDKSKSVSRDLGAKNIVLNGYIVASTPEDLLNKLDILKKTAYSTNMVLSITYGSSSRQYIVDFVSFSPVEKNITYIEYSLTLSANDPAGQSIIATDVDYPAVTGDLSETINFSGSFKPEPNIEITINSETDLTEIALTVNGNTLTMTEAFDVDDVLLINIAEKKVLLNATEIDFEGAFPEFVPGNNIVLIEFTSTVHNADINFNYYSKWL